MLQPPQRTKLNQTIRVMQTSLVSFSSACMAVQLGKSLFKFKIHAM